MKKIPASLNKPYAESCDQNKDVILSVLKELYVDPGNVLEIGSGTGQHVVFFASHMPHLNWHPSDRQENLAGIQAWVDEVNLDNVMDSVSLDVTEQPWPISQADYIYSANSVHIMSWVSVQALFAGLKSVLNRGGLFALYGPFNYAGAYTSASNERFDQWLKQRDPLSGIRDFNELDTLARQSDLSFVQDYEMPANNRILVWKKD
jgi:cyclopropane fatty-acyl-phospholipid synthase-like methyltransferase